MDLITTKICGSEENKDRNAGKDSALVVRNPSLGCVTSVIVTPVSPTETGLD